MLKKIILLCGVGFILKKILDSKNINLSTDMENVIKNILDIPLKQVNKTIDDIFDE